MRTAAINGEGILLQVRQAGAGGRQVRFFTPEAGQQSGFIARSALKKYGTGALFPFARIRYSAVRTASSEVITQYEGRQTVDMLGLSYAGLCQWYYAAEIALRCFPEGEADGEAYVLLCAGAEAGRTRHPAVTAMILSAQLLRAAGYDPGEAEPVRALALSGGGRRLLAAMLAYPWQGGLASPVTAAAFRETASYLDKFCETYCDLDLKTRGAFLLTE